MSIAPPVLIVGCGDVGLRVALRLRAQQVPVLGVVRRPDAAQALAQAGIKPLLHDLDGHAPLPDAAQVFWFAPPPAQGRSDPLLRAWLATPRRGAARRIVYISTSGVYGDCQGRWIDEDEPLKPQTERAHRRVDAEQALLAHAQAHGDAVILLRVPGIYGPGRLPVERLRQNLPVVEDAPDADARHWTNRIHADDLATAACAAMQRGAPGRAYNIADGHPSTMADYFTRCARLLGLPDPPRVPLAEARRRLSPALMSFLDESKRLRNRRMRDELGVVLRYPSLEHGLPSCLA